MSRDHELAKTKYKGKQSASTKAKAKEQAKENKKSGSGDDRMAAMRSAMLAPRSQASKDRAAAHRRSLPPLG